MIKRPVAEPQAVFEYDFQTPRIGADAYTEVKWAVFDT